MIRLLRLVQPYYFALAGVLALAFLQSLANLWLPTLMADMVDTGIVQGDSGYILRVGGLMALITIGGAICAIAGSYLSARIAIGFGGIIRRRIFAQVEYFSLHEFDAFSTASLITRTTNDTAQVQQVLIMFFSMVITAPMMAVGGIVMAYAEDAALVWVLVAIMPVVVIIFTTIMRRGIPLYQGMQMKIDKLNLVLKEALTGVRVVRAFDRNAHEHRRFDAANLDVTDTAVAVSRIVALLLPAMMLTVNVAGVAILWFGSIRVANGEMQVGAVIAFLQYSMLILFSLMMLSMMFIMLPRAAASAARINEVLDVVPEINDPAAPRSPDIHRGVIEFQHVTFRYPGAEEPALSDITFRAGPGEVTAIIGGTGAGKTTLVNLIPRFYDVDAGHVLVDGIDVRELTQADLRARIGLAPQTAVLFSGTVAQNIRFGAAGATEDEVRHAARIAQAADFIEQMPQEFAAPIAQGGANVSGGQKQRLSIARVLLRRPEIYIFDDSFSALDFTTDARLRAALRRETAVATVLIIAQRVGTIMDADQIIVLDEGRIVGRGKHQELLATNDIYREIVVSQLTPEETL